jgi:hypothetical protein
MTWPRLNGKTDELTRSLFIPSRPIGFCQMQREEGFK